MFWGPGIPEGSLKPEELRVGGAVGGGQSSSIRRGFTATWWPEELGPGPDQGAARTELRAGTRQPEAGVPFISPYGSCQTPETLLSFSSFGTNLLSHLLPVSSHDQITAGWVKGSPALLGLNSLLFSLFS